MAGTSGSGNKNPPSTTVWIGDLPGVLDEATFTEIFSAYGTVTKTKLIPPKWEGAKACGFVTFENQDEATWIVENLDGNLAQGLEEPIVCNYGMHKSADKGKGAWGGGAGGAAWGGQKGGFQQKGGPYDGGFGGKGKGQDFSGGKANGKGGAAASIYQAVKGSGILGGGIPPLENQLYIANLPPDADDLFLYQVFAPFGALAATGVKAMLGPDGACKGVGFVDFQDAQSAEAAATAINGQFGLVVTQKMDKSQKGKGGWDKGGGKGKFNAGNES